MCDLDSKRRNFLASLSTTCLIAICNPLVIAGTRQNQTEKSLADLLVAQLGDRRSARVVGHEYLRSAIDEADIGSLVTLILGDHEGQKSVNLDVDYGACHAQLQYRMKSDFASGHVVDVGGWILSETEARLCALAASM